jgi:hypothetical protein
VNDLVELQVEVSEILQEPDYLLYLLPSLIKVYLHKIDVMELRAWLFETYTICNDIEAYSSLNDRIKASHKYSQSALQLKSI